MTIKSAPFPAEDSLLLAGPLGVAADDLDLVRLDITRVVKLEVDILDQERPNLVAETVGIEMTLCLVTESASSPDRQPVRVRVL